MTGDRSNGGANPYTLNLPGLTADGKPSSGISFTKGELANAGTRIESQTELLSRLNQSSTNLPVPWPHFGVLGMGVQSVHEKAIESQRSALERAREALETWQPALVAADKNYKKADDESGKPPGSDLPPGGLPTGLPKTDLPTGLPKTDLPGTDLPGTDLPGTNLPGTNLPGTDLPGTDVPGSDLPGSDLPGSDVPGSDLPGGNLPGTDLPGTNLPGANGNQPNIPTTDPADTRVPDLDSALNPNKTDLSAFQPTATPQVPTIDPNAAGLNSRTGVPGSIGLPGSGTGAGGGIGAGGALPGGAAAALRGAAGSSGMPMMPMMPMSGAGANGNQERDRDKTVGLGEDEGVWGGDEDIAPPVLGQEDDLL
ncbi:pentapeptide repeat-containing protein [Actinomadura sp. ATCC 31491]|uniref:Pentapeptide repeat-containing protein n=1 Tax=Actinomadura luzonensis TaxID=2805427 RepID=A0ABT0G9L6_9ACTN|nr:pentapeptide repeat-containing protein [Actinomadura luzonensis]MCK2221290.1 pentapeptide repeat-containing protein [Actinomadura luzonensis]